MNNIHAVRSNPHRDVAVSSTVAQCNILDRGDWEDKEVIVLDMADMVVLVKEVDMINVSLMI